tara:strand:- start:52 stop:480 length:429 start_codon:yes stop_codon:yes gene_type:complete
MPNFTPLVNGVAYAYADIVVSILGAPIAGITSVKYDDKQDIVNNYGAGTFPTSRGFGKYEATCTLTLDRAELGALLSAAPNNRLQDIGEFDITVSYVPVGNAPQTDIIKNCRFSNTPSGGDEGDSMIMSEMEIVTSHILWNQ